MSSPSPGDSAAARAEELARRHADLESGSSSTAQDVELAVERAAQSRKRAEAAHRSAARAHEESALIHERAAEFHDRAGHARVAQEHREAARRDRAGRSGRSPTS